MFARLAVAAAALLDMGASPSEGSLVLRFDGLKGGGEVDIALFADDLAWKTHRRPVRTLEAKISQGAAQARIEGLAPGQYGVMAYHDHNSNDRLDVLPIGLPTEPYGFSNNARGTFGPPPWSAARFTVTSGQTAVQAIRLH